MSCTQIMFHHSTAYLHHYHHQNSDTTAHTSPATQATLPDNHSTLSPEYINRRLKDANNSCFLTRGFHTSSFPSSSNASSFTQLHGCQAQYLSANCVVVTHYSGDAASEVDEHFSRALSSINNQQAVTSTSVSPQLKSKLSKPTSTNSANNDWHDEVTPSLWSCDSNLGSPPSSPLDLAGPRTTLQENAFPLTGYPEPWPATQHVSNSTTYHFQTTGSDTTEVPHRDLFWY